MKLLKYILIGLASCWLAKPVAGQQLVEISLPNGHVLRGQLLPQARCSGIRLTVLPGDTLCVPFGQFDHVRYPRYPKKARRRNDISPSDTVQNGYAAQPQQQKPRFQPPAAPVAGWYKRIGVGASLVYDAAEWRSPVQGSFWLAAGYQLDSRWSVGIATGFDDLPVDQIPLLASVRWRTDERPHCYFCRPRWATGFWPTNCSASYPTPLGTGAG